MTINETLTNIQNELKVAKTQWNKFGGYNYRSCEDILEAVKPVLAKNKATLIITDDIVMLGDRFYIKATATLKSDDGEISVNGLARESLTKKGMDESQITGATSSYARKYALNGLFAIDDSEEIDSIEVQSSEKPEVETEVKLKFTDKVLVDIKTKVLPKYSKITIQELIKMTALKYDVTDEVKEKLKTLLEENGNN